MHKRLVEEILMLDNGQGRYSVAELAGAIGVSAKTVREDIRDINLFLRRKNLGQLVLKAGVIEVSCRLKPVIREICNLTFSEYFLSREERLVGESLFLAFSGNHTTMQEMADFLSASRSTVLLDMNGLKEFLAPFQLRLVGYSSQGSELEGEEIGVRRLFAFIFGKWTLLVKIFVKTLMKWQGGIGNACLAEEYLKECRAAISETEKETRMYLSDHSYEWMLFYLVFASCRISAGCPLRWEGPGRRRDAFMVSLFKRMGSSRFVRLNACEEDFACSLLSDLYYVKGKLQDENLLKLQMLTRRLIDRVSKELGCELYRDYLLFESLTQHFERIFHARGLEGPKMLGAADVLAIAKEHEDVLVCVRKHLSIWKQYVPRELEEWESAYIVVYICAAMNRLAQEECVSNVIIVCHGGLGTGQLIRSQILSHFQVEVKAVLASHCLAYEKLEEIDFIISTIALEHSPLPHIVISPVLKDGDFNRIRGMAERFKRKRRGAGALQRPRLTGPAQSLSRLLTPEFIRLDGEAGDWREAIALASQPLLRQGKISEAYVEDMIRAIQEHGPYVVLCEGFALPHASTDHVYETGMSLLRLKTPVAFGAGDMDPIGMVCVLCPKDSEGHLEALFDLCNIWEDPAGQAVLCGSASAEEIWRMFCEREK